MMEGEKKLSEAVQNLSIAENLQEIAEEQLILATDGKVQSLYLKKNDKHANGYGVKEIAWKREFTKVGMVAFAKIPSGGLVIGANSHLFCVDPKTSKSIWEAKHPPPPAPSKDKIQIKMESGNFQDIMAIGYTTTEGGRVYSVANGTVIVLDAKTGNLIWEAKIHEWLGGLSSLYASTIGNTLVVGNNGKIYGYDLTNGDNIWTNKLLGRGHGAVTVLPYPNGIEEQIFIGSNGYVMSAKAKNGDILHTANLDGAGYNPVTMLYSSAHDTLFVGISGETRAYKPDGLKKLWKSKLPGMGYSLGHSFQVYEKLLLIGMNGKVCALDVSNGEQKWKVQLPGSGNDLVTLSLYKKALFAGTKGKLFQLLVETGEVIISIDLKALGANFTTLVSALSNVDFNSCTIPSMLEGERTTRDV